MVKCGIEIHQRLATARKLFCGCNAMVSGKKEGELKRSLHPVASELGEIDVAAQFEQLKGRTFVYDIHDGSTCLVEADEEPPHLMNKEAVQIVLAVCAMMKADIVDEIHVMRKTVIDGSNTAGFQRTAIVGMNGKIKTSFGEIMIPRISLEEESAGIIGELERAEEGRFRLDRLGIPLIEISTSADIKNGQQAREVADQIGLMLRATGKVQRGIGTIRQDLNISVEGGARVEIKGVQELDLVDDAVEKEIVRQKGLIRICEKIKKIKKRAEEARDVTELFNGTECKFVREAIWRGGRVFAQRFSGMKGLFGTEVCDGYRYGQELNGYAKSVGVGGIIHSDENLKRYGFGEEIKRMEKELGIGSEDGWIIIVGQEQTCRKALAVVHERAYLTNVPEETRHALIDGSSEYMRPLPGAARMYPETDVVPFKVTQEDIVKAAEGVPDFEALKKRISKLLNPELAKKMIRSPYLGLFEKIVEKKVDPTLVAVTLEDTLKVLRREGVNIERISEDTLVELFEQYRDGLFAKAAIPEILREIAKVGGTVAGAVKRKGLTKISGFELRKLIKEIGAKDVGDVMQKHRMRVDADEIRKLLKGK